ncbi:MAG: phosphoesterase [Desulfovibrio sp.]|nr:phosphoesterase [Desulfovibrio sp.]
MAGLPEYIVRMKQWRAGLSKDERWCIVISADPDAMAAAMALKRIMQQKVRSVDIARVNEVTRPDNLAMIRYLSIPLKPWQADKAQGYAHLALVDSQPHHNKAFQNLRFDCIIDHHPLPPANGNQILDKTAPGFLDIRPGIGATSTMMTRYLQALRLRPGPRLATALLYGIRTDTGIFERSGGEEDFRAYQWLSQHADNGLIRRITRSEYLRGWLPLFARAFRSLSDCRGGAHVSLKDVDSADLLVAIADFFTKVHGLKWIAVSGVVNKTVVVIFRCDGSRDIGRLADACFHDVGEAGGHRNMARAEFPLASVPEGVKPGDFIRKRLETRKLRPATSPKVSAGGQ